MGTISSAPSCAGQAGHAQSCPGSALARTRTVMVALIEIVFGWQRRAMERETLAAMDDRMLRDIGLERMHIEPAVRGLYSPLPQDADVPRPPPQPFC